MEAIYSAHSVTLIIIVAAMLVVPFYLLAAYVFSGAPARVDGTLQIVEAFRFPEAFDQYLIPVFITNTLLFDADALDRDFPLSWFAVRKKVKGAEALQFERLVGELSAFLPATYVRVEREGADARFQPVKDPAELARRQEEILVALRSRGILAD